MKAFLFLFIPLFGCANERSIKFCSDDLSQALYINARQNTVLWNDLEYGYGNRCRTRCLAGFEDVENYILNLSKAEKSITEHEWIIEVDRGKFEETYVFSFLNNNSDSLYVSGSTPAVDFPAVKFNRC